MNLDAFAENYRMLHRELIMNSIIIIRYLIIDSMQATKEVYRAECTLNRKKCITATTAMRGV